MAWRLGLAVVAICSTTAHQNGDIIVAAAAAALAPTSTFRLLQSQHSTARCDQLDFNDSGRVDVADLLLCLSAFGQPTNGPGAQFAVSGGPAVSVSDLLLVLSAYGSTCSGTTSALGAESSGGVDVDPCGCRATEGWSSSAGACTSDGHTSNTEAARCATPSASAPPPERPPPAAADACVRLAEEGLDCGACIPATSLPPPSSAATVCPMRTAVQDADAERAGRWRGRRPRALYNQTEHLWAEDAPVRTIILEMSEQSWEFLVNDPTAEAYTEATVRIAGLATVGEADRGTPAEHGVWTGVGVRFKGYWGSLRTCFRGSSTLAQSDCRKLSFKIKFNYVNPEARFFGLKKIMLHATLADETLMRERLSYSLWREMGVPAPRSTHMDVGLRLTDSTHPQPGTVGTRPVGAAQDAPWPLGMHLLTEVIDGRFTDTNFRGGDNNLWKEAWPGMERGPLEYLLETNQNVPDAVTRLEEFRVALESASNDWELVQVVREFMKARTVSKYWAVDRAVDMWDGPIFFRQQAGGYFNHNYFLVQSDDGDPGEFSIVPWDVDDTFTAEGRTSCELFDNHQLLPFNPWLDSLSIRSWS
jgi:hypothetical protein